MTRAFLYIKQLWFSILLMKVSGELDRGNDVQVKLPCKQFFMPHHYAKVT